MRDQIRNWWPETAGPQTVGPQQVMWAVGPQTLRYASVPRPVGSFPDWSGHSLTRGPSPDTESQPSKDIDIQNQENLTETDVMLPHPPTL